MDTQRDSKQEIVNTGKDLASMDSEGKGTSRRKFTRNALVGSAVLLTLSNRSAWGAIAPKVCISTNVLVSYANNQASAVTRHQQEVDEYYSTYNGEEEYTDPDNTDRTCYDPNPEPVIFETETLSTSISNKSKKIR